MARENARGDRSSERCIINLTNKIILSISSAFRLYFQLSSRLRSDHFIRSLLRPFNLTFLHHGSRPDLYRYEQSRPLFATCLFPPRLLSIQEENKDKNVWKNSRRYLVNITLLEEIQEAWPTDLAAGKILETS